jgi:hypothetical protein
LELGLRRLRHAPQQKRESLGCTQQTSAGVRISTAAIRAWRALDRTPDERAVQWAVNLLVAGQDTPSLRVLAGLNSPLDYFETTKLIDRALAELGVPRLDVSESIEVYAAELLADLLNHRREMRTVLGELEQLCIAMKYEKSLMPFYLLENAFHQLGAVGTQFYWKGVDSSNIAHIVQEQARAYLDAHRRAT